MYWLILHQVPLTLITWPTSFINKLKSDLAVPVPVPTPEALNQTPTVLALAPIAVKSVVPTATIL